MTNGKECEQNSAKQSDEIGFKKKISLARMCNSMKNAFLLGRCVEKFKQSTQNDDATNVFMDAGGYAAMICLFDESALFGSVVAELLDKQNTTFLRDDIIDSFNEIDVVSFVNFEQMDEEFFRCIYTIFHQIIKHEVETAVLTSSPP
jgi:hypothetical protein